MIAAGSFAGTAGPSLHLRQFRGCTAVVSRVPAEPLCSRPRPWDVRVKRPVSTAGQDFVRGFGDARGQLSLTASVSFMCALCVSLRALPRSSKRLRRSSAEKAALWTTALRATRSDDALEEEEGMRKRRLTSEEREELASMMDGNGPFRNITGFIGLLLAGKALPDMIFSVIKQEYGMLGIDAVLALVGAGLLWTAVKFLGPPEIPEDVMEDDPMLRMLPPR
eukprot:TRINITY_DN32898_c0_g1_i1.p1 TRINITY_DN32898_c0_g1~~TRINITY_DN32898_c0_g1_i1.p1  ORF type:complete len:222 (-),score=34.39 TRINITY_DN32898_c0_g1_i1:230-895(-)